MTARTQCPMAALLGTGGRGRISRGLAAALLALMSGCADYPPLLNPDAMALVVILEAGALEAGMVAIHPHRSVGETSQWERAGQWEEAAQWIVRDAVLRGPGWTVSFADTLEECNGRNRRPPACARTEVELRAELPEPVAPATTYIVEGEGVLGPFHCTIEVPASPVLLDIPDTLRIPMDTAVFVPFGWEVGPEIGALWVAGDVEITGEFGVDSSETMKWYAATPNGTGADSVSFDTSIDPWEKISRIVWRLHLAGSGWNREEFRRIPGELWHAKAAEAAGFAGAGGVVGEGAYGYCDGVSYSRKAVIIAE